jgi:chromosome segregation ATPase
VRSHHLRLLALAVVASTGLTACAADNGDEVEELRAELISRTEAEEELVTRLDRLEEELATLGADVSTVTRLDGLEDQLERVQATITVLDDQLEDEVSARRSAQEDGEVAVTDLRATIVELQSGMDELRAETEELRTLYETLRDRLDRQQRE